MGRADRPAEPDQVADGDTPWCIGIESGAATGWPATDWIEDLMLRTTTPENYDKWVTGELKFNSPEVKKAVQTMADIWLDDANVNGGASRIVTTVLRRRAGGHVLRIRPSAGSIARATSSPASSRLKAKRRASTTTSSTCRRSTPSSASPSSWPATSGQRSRTSRKSLALLEWFTKGEHLKPWMEAGGAIAPHKDADLAWYGSDIERKVAPRSSRTRPSVRFDASDLMPGAVGTGSFWKEITSFISGSEDLDTTLSNIDASLAAVGRFDRRRQPTGQGSDRDPCPVR